MYRQMKLLTFYRCGSRPFWFVKSFLSSCSANRLHDYDTDLNTLHTPVMVNEILQYLKPKANGFYLDMTFGAGGHTKALLSKEASITVVTLDRDPSSVSLAQQLSNVSNSTVIPLEGKFSQLNDLLMEINMEGAIFDGIIMDLGASSMQLTSSERGFSLVSDGPLDMRMTPTDKITAEDVLKFASEEDLARIIKCYGEEKYAKKIARCVWETRYRLSPLKTTHQLAELVSSMTGSNYYPDKVGRPAHVATRTFQALRIFVNDELNEIEKGIKAAHNCLKPGGRLAVLSFHSLEDRIVKELFHCFDTDSKAFKNLQSSVTGLGSTPIIKAFDEAKKKSWKQLHKHVIVPSESEVEENKRSRSAKLRVAVKT